MRPKKVRSRPAQLVHISLSYERMALLFTYRRINPRDSFPKDVLPNLQLLFPSSLFHFFFLAVTDLFLARLRFLFFMRCRA